MQPTFTFTFSCVFRSEKLHMTKFFNKRPNSPLFPSGPTVYFHDWQCAADLRPHAAHQRNCSRQRKDCKKDKPVPASSKARFRRILKSLSRNRRYYRRQIRHQTNCRSFYTRHHRTCLFKARHRLASVGN